MPMTATPSARGLAGRGRGQPRRTAGRSGMLLLRSSLKEYRLQLLQICTDNTALCPQLPSLTESLACKWRLLRLPPSWRPCARVPCSTQDRAKRIRLRSIRARLRLRCSIPSFKGATVPVAANGKGPPQFRGRVALDTGARFPSRIKIQIKFPCQSSGAPVGPPPFPAAPLHRLGFPCLPFLSLCVGGGVPCVADRAQLGRVGGSRWGWVL